MSEDKRFVKYELTYAEREQVDALIVRMRQPSQSPNKPNSAVHERYVDKRTPYESAQGPVIMRVPKKPEVYVPREDAFYEEG